MKDNEIKNGTSNNSECDDFKTQWKRRQQWQELAKKAMPDDETLLRWTEKARENYNMPEVNIIPFPSHRRNRWIPYAAAACIAIGVATIGLNRQEESNSTLPEAKEVKVEGQTVRFLCNNGCSALEVLLSANEVIN